MLLHNATTGAFEVYEISNNDITSAASLDQVGLDRHGHRRLQWRRRE
jgi:hypothetical protein